MKDPSSALAEETKQLCLKVAQEAYEEAGLRGMCLEERWSYALDAIQRLDLQQGLLSDSG